MSYLNILHTSGLDVKFGHFSSSPGKLTVFHIFAHQVLGTQNKKMYKHLCYQLKVTIKGDTWIRGYKIFYFC